MLCAYSCKSKKSAAAGSSIKSIDEVQIKAAFIDAQGNIAIGNKDEAKKTLNAILKQDPTCDACMFQLSKLAMEQFQFQEALQLGEAAFNAKPNNAFYRELYAEMLYRKGNPLQAANVSKVLIDSFPTIREHYRRTIFYYENAKKFEEAKSIVHRFQYHFGYVYETGQMYEELYKKNGDMASLLQNKKSLIEKYPKDIQLRKEYINTLIDQNRLATADSQLNELIELEVNTGYAYLLKTRINMFEQNWTAYVQNFNNACLDEQLDAKTKTNFLIKNESIKDSSILNSIRKIVIDDPNAIEFYNYYGERFGIKVDDQHSKANAFIKNPDNFELGATVVNNYLKSQNFDNALQNAHLLYENHPSRYTSYWLYSISLLRVGRFAEANIYADNGLTYALSNDEMAALYTVKAFANYYLADNSKTMTNMEKAWSLVDTSKMVLEQLVYLSLFTNSNKEKIEKTLKSLGNGEVSRIYSLYQKPFSEYDWNLQLSGSVLSTEAAMLSAIKAKDKQAAIGFLKRLVNLAPANQYYQNKLKEVNRL
mgnify:CR=1 FL=1